MIASYCSKLDTVLLLLIFSVPSSFQLPPPAIPISDFFITLPEICIFGLLAHFVLDLLTKYKIYKSPFDSCFLLLLAYFCFSLCLGTIRYGFTSAFGDFRYFLPLFLYFTIVRFFGLSCDIIRVRRLMFNVMIIVAFYVLVVFLFFRSELMSHAQIHMNKLMDDRVFFDNTLLLLMIYAGYLYSRAILNNMDRRFLFFFFALNGLMLLVMQVRTYWVTFMLIIGMAAFQQRAYLFRSRFNIVTTFWIVTTALTTIMLLNIVPIEIKGFDGALISISERFTSLVNINQTLFQQTSTGETDTETIGTRMVTAQTVWDDYIMKYPVFGTGFGGELPIMSRFGGTVLMRYSIDNGFLTILAKFGIVGAVLYTLLFWRILLVLFRILTSRYANKEEKLLSRSFLAGIAAMAVASLFSSVFVRQQPALIGFLFMLTETTVMHRNIEARNRQAIIIETNRLMQRDASQ